MTLALRATNDGGGIILLNGSPKITLDAAGNIVGTLTPGRGDSSQKLANTEFVKQMMGNFRGHVQIQVPTTLSAAQAGYSVQLTAETSQVALPLANSVPEGTAYHVTNTWSANNSVSKQPSDQLLVGGSGESSLSLGFGESATVVSNGVNVWYVIGGTELLKRANMFGSLKSQNGWQKLPSGLILQWASVFVTYTGVSTYKGTLNFPIPFPSAVLNVVCSSSDTVNPSYACAQPANNQSASWAHVSAGPVGPGGNYLRCTAIGY